MVVQVAAAMSCFGTCGIQYPVYKLAPVKMETCPYKPPAKIRIVAIGLS